MILPGEGTVVLFCGLAGTLKTFLASRMCARLGWVYLPTRAVGAVDEYASSRTLLVQRTERYERCARIVLVLVEMGANIIVDGSYPTRLARHCILAAVQPNRKIIVYCHCDNDLRYRRLRIRTHDALDYGSASAKAILDQNGVKGMMEESPFEDLLAGEIQALLEVDTTAYRCTWHGCPPEDIGPLLLSILEEALYEYQRCPLPASFEEQVHAHFDNLALQYDENTTWRGDPVLLSHLRRDLFCIPSKVLDIGTGTGLATAWYTEQGHHVVGLDLSPVMLTRATERLTLTVLGSALDLPFLDAYFDLVVIRQCLHYTEPTIVLAETKRVLRTDGWFALSAIIVPNERARRLWLEFKAVTQPLRLDVYTESRLINLLKAADFRVEQTLHYKLPRREPVSNLRARAPEPHGGWLSFLEHIVHLSSREAPEIQLCLDGENLEYCQYWVTLWARKDM